MSTLTLSLPAPRRLALRASRLLERWAMRPDVSAHQRRESAAYEQAVAARDRFSMDALARTLLS
ncbi:hypothetical protein [Agrococcus sp. DT81.2]|uniref:hypothetical protein n=1 Tax=Agrococcus sp. DT81.2 TaxID=3393414 RepID=UPI003CE5C2E8